MSNRKYHELKLEISDSVLRLGSIVSVIWHWRRELIIFHQNSNNITWPILSNLIADLYIFPILLVELCDPNREGSVHPQIKFSLRNRRAKKSYSISASKLTNFERDDYSNQVSICKLFTFKRAVPAIHGRTGKNR